VVKFFEEILNVFADNRGMAEKICKNAGYSSGTNLLKAFKKPSGEFEKFSGLIYIVNEAFGSDSKEKFLTFAQQLNPNKATSKSLLEYAAQNRHEETRNHLIEEFLKSNKREVKEWGIVYDLDRKSTNRELTGYNLINEVSPVQFKQPEVKVFAKLVQVYEFYDMKEYDFMETLAENLEEEIKSLQNEFIRDSFLMRFCLIMASVKFHKGHLEESRNYAKVGLLHTLLENYKSLFYVYLGNSYMFDNYSLSKSYLNRGLETALEGSYQVTELKRSLNFLENMWEKEAKYLSYNSKEVSDMHEVIFASINSGHLQYANLVMKEVEQKEMTASNKAFNNYLKWMLTNQEEYLLKSIKHFKECGDNFYIKLPITKLESIGYNRLVIDMLVA
jgi:hypothetical protein